MMELLDTGLKAGGWTAAFAALLWFINQRLPKTMSPQEEKDASLESMRKTIKFQGDEITKLQNDVHSLRKDIRQSAIKAHKLLMAVHHCVTKFPETSAWWDDQLAKLEREI